MIKKRKLKNKYKYVYDKTLRNHLIDNGFSFITTAYASSSKNRFWLFEADADLYAVIDNYEQMKKVS